MLLWHATQATYNRLSTNYFTNTTMRTILLTLLIIIAAFLSVLFAIPYLGNISLWPPQQTTLLLYSSGKRLTIYPTSNIYPLIVTPTEEIFASATSGIPLGISTSLLDHIRNSDTAVEVLFVPPTEITPTFPDVSNLLVVLDGDHKGWMFHGSHWAYAPGPLLTTDVASLQTLASLVRSQLAPAH